MALKTYGLVGNNISYSLSPAMHNAAFKKLRMNAEYKIFDLASHEADKFFKGLLKSGIAGINVTVPYKIKAFEFVSRHGRIDKETSRYGAINTIVIRKGKLDGFNTDTTGFVRSLKEDLGFNPNGKTVFMFGAGGAGSACVIKLAETAGRIFIFDLDKEKVSGIQKLFYKNFDKKKLVVVNGESEIKYALAQSHLLVNATPYGRKPEEILVNPAYLHDNLAVYDLIYKPKETPIIKEAKKRALKVSNGLGMLLYQGAEAFKKWTGRTPPVKVMRSALVRALNY